MPSTERNGAELGGATELAIVHALAWLAAGSLIGLGMATLLLWPQAGAWLAPLTYGRWATLHLDLLLYGWCSLPVVGLLLRGFGASSLFPRGARFAVVAWSGVVLFASLWWLSGHSSGRLFVEWVGPSRVLFVGALAWLWIVLAVGHSRRDAARTLAKGGAWKHTLLLGALAVVPWAFWSGTRADYHPPVNPASGGPTGAGLLASSLGMVALLLIAPRLLGLEERAGSSIERRCWLGLGAHLAFFALVRGEHSHHEPLQVVALASVAIWFPLVLRVWRRYSWPRDAVSWGSALAVWGGVLVATAGIPYLVPGVLDAWKFTNALVAHAHLAMAGMLTSFVAVLIAVLAKGTRMEGALESRRLFRLWHGGCGVFVVSMAALGGLEAAQPGRVFDPGAGVLVLYAIRWVAGLAMAAASIGWLRTAHRSWSTTPSVATNERPTPQGLWVAP